MVGIMIIIIYLAMTMFIKIQVTSQREIYVTRFSSHCACLGGKAISQRWIDRGEDWETPGRGTAPDEQWVSILV